MTEQRLSALQVWVSSVTEITAADLRVQDADSPPEELRYMVTPPSNGHLALKSAPTQAVYNFTQAHIDQGQLLFVHKGIFPSLLSRLIECSLCPCYNHSGLSLRSFLHECTTELIRSR